MWWTGLSLVGVGAVAVLSFGPFLLVWGATTLVIAALGSLDHALGRAQYILGVLLALALTDFAAITIRMTIAPIALTALWWLLGSLAALAVLVGLESIRLRFAAGPACNDAYHGMP
jgi:hypothetical protein